jgi:membrane protein YqaA with SNARE-associated domain
MSLVTPEGKGIRGEVGWVRRNVIPILSLSFAILISVGIFLMWRFYPERLESLKHLGYFGAFLISLLFNASIILPAGNFLALAALGAVMPLPILVGVAAGVGAAIGECTGYMAGYSGRKAVERTKFYVRVEGWMEHWGLLTIFIFSLCPLFFDVAGLAAGVLKFPFWKFVLMTWLGRTIFYIGIAYAGYYGWDTLLRLLVRG